MNCELLLFGGSKDIFTGDLPIDDILFDSVVETCFHLECECSLNTEQISTSANLFSWFLDFRSLNIENDECITILLSNTCHPFSRQPTFSGCGYF